MRKTGTIYWFFATLAKSFGTAFFDLRTVNHEKLIQDRGVLIVANHESYVDPPFIGVSFQDSIYYLARKTLFRSVGGWLYPKLNAVPVDQERPDMTSLKNIIKLLKAGERVLLFPEGERTLTGELGEAQAGVGLIISKAKVPVQPMRIVGAKEALPRGSGKMSRHPIKVVVGDPIEFTAEELAAKGREGYQQLADKVMAEIARLTTGAGVVTDSTKNREDRL